MSKHWTQEEIDYLQDNFGYKSFEKLAKNLKRSVVAVRLKASRLDLGDPREATEFITVNQLSKTIGVTTGTLYRWSEIHNFPILLRKFSHKPVKSITLEMFWKWAESHVNMIEWDKFERHSLGAEPDWTEVARQAAFKRAETSKNSMKKTSWTIGDDSKLKFMLKQNKYTYPDLTDALGRTQGAIKRRIHALDLKGRPISLSCHNPYSEKDIEVLLDMYRKGHGFDVIAKKLNRSEAGVRGKMERMGYTFKNRVAVKV